MFVDEVKAVLFYMVLSRIVLQLFLFYDEIPIKLLLYYSFLIGDRTLMEDADILGKKRPLHIR